MKIKELEELTGVTKQNIRFYESKGLLMPQRNPENDYREYSEEDVRRLQMIKMFRMLDMPIEEIRKLLQGECSMEAVMEEHLNQLLYREQQLKGAIEICKDLLHRDMEQIEPEAVLEKMETMGRSGQIFADILHDYKLVSEFEQKKSFSFKPDTMALNPQEFREALEQFAGAEGAELVMLQGGMYPVFLLDGVEYTAHRTFGRYGAVIHCEMTRPELYEPEELKAMPEGKKKKLKMIRIAIQLFGVFFICWLMTMGRSIGATIVVFLVMVVLPGTWYGWKMRRWK